MPKVRSELITLKDTISGLRENRLDFTARREALGKHANAFFSNVGGLPHRGK